MTIEETNLELTNIRNSIICLRDEIYGCYSENQEWYSSKYNDGKFLKHLEIILDILNLLGIK